MPEISAKRNLSYRSSCTVSVVYVWGQQMASAVSTVGRGSASHLHVFYPFTQGRKHQAKLQAQSSCFYISAKHYEHIHTHSFLLLLDLHQSLPFKPAYRLTHSHPHMHCSYKAPATWQHTSCCLHCAHAHMHLQREREIINIHAKKLSKACLQNQ